MKGEKSPSAKAEECATCCLCAQDSYDMPDGDMSGMEEEKAEAEKAVEDSGAPEQKTPW